VSSGETNRAGHFSVTLPPGEYQVANVYFKKVWGLQDSIFVSHGNPSQEPDRRPAEVTVRAGEHITIDFAFETMAICLAAGDSIATPTGPVPVTQVRRGMLVWTLDGAGRRVAAPVLLVGHTPALPGHHVVRVLLSDGRTVDASPGHPTADGRRVGELKPGDLLDGSHVSAVERVPYSSDTWDLLPAGGTGAYWANDVLLGSTLGTSPASPSSVSPPDRIHLR
jgi:hypothetical protein